MNRAFIIAARRTPVAPRGGAFAGLELHELAAPVIRAVLADAGLPAGRVGEVILGNALSGGGNPARLAALAAGLPESVPAMTLDTQCCSGLDAVLLAADRVRAGAADVVVAGGAESYSRAPIRMVRPKAAGEEPRAYERPPFTPWQDRDPDMIPAAAALAERLGITRADQEAFAVASHGRALAARPMAEVVAVGITSEDAFTRDLSPAACRRLPVLAGGAEHGVTAATVAVEADAAAVVLVVSEAVARDHAGPVLEIVGGARAGGDPVEPGLALVPAARQLLDSHAVGASDLAVAEIMEAFAAQVIAGITSLGLEPGIVNRGGGALARGHPIGASGAVLAVRLFHELVFLSSRTERSGEPGSKNTEGWNLEGGVASFHREHSGYGSRLKAGMTKEENVLGLAAIAAAGGLGSAMLVRAVTLG
jgi:acetyl-CoA C-acetyltransferase